MAVSSAWVSFRKHPPALAVSALHASFGAAASWEPLCVSGRERQVELDDYKHIVYHCLVIRSFADPDTERFYTTGKSRRLLTEIRTRAGMRLMQLNAANRIGDLRLPPSNRLEALKHDRAGQWSIRVNDQWRVCFRFSNGDARDVEIVDYH
jgi:proteic killer suppression protein